MGLYDGTANSYPSTMHHAGSFSYGGVGAQLGAADFGTGVTYQGGSLTNFLRAAFAANDPTAYFMFRGDESSTTKYTYKRFTGEMYLTVNKPANAATLSQPANQATQVSVTPLMTAAANDPEGDPVQYKFRIGRTVNPDQDVIWESGWAFSHQAQVPSNLLLGGTTYYWRVLTRDYCSSDGDPCGYGPQAAPSVTGVWAFTTNTPPNPLSSAGASPAAGTVATTTPTLSVAPTTDPDNGPQPLKYWFTVATGTDGRTGAVVSSGWLTGTTWTVPAGYLRDGVSYTWTAWAFDGSSKDQGVWSNRLTVDMRTGDPKSSPVDSLGAVTANLANGNLIYSTGSPTTSFAKSQVGLNFTYNSMAVGVDRGLRSVYAQDLDKDGVRDPEDVPVLQRTEPTVNTDWSTESPYPGVLNPDNFFVTWSGRFTAPASGQYLFGATHDDTFTVTVNGTQAYYSGCCFTQKYQADKPITLTAGASVPFTAELTEFGGHAYATVYVKRVDGAPLTPGGPTEMPIPTSWLSTATAPALPTGWTLSTDVDGDAAYSHALVSEGSITLVDATGAPHTYTRTSSGDGTGWTPPAGEQGTISVAAAGTGSGGQITVNDPDGSRSVFAPDGALREYHPADVTGSGTALQYTWSGNPARLKEVTDPVSTLKVQFFYQRSGEVCYPGATTPAGMSGTAPADHLCRIAYPDGESSLLWYDGNGRLARLADPGGENTDLAYDSNGRLAKVRDPLANDAIAAGAAPNDDTAVSLIGYDTAARVTSITGPEPGAGVARPAHRYTYSSAPAGSTDGETRVTEDGVTDRVQQQGHLQRSFAGNQQHGRAGPDQHDRIQRQGSAGQGGRPGRAGVHHGLRLRRPGRRLLRARPRVLLHRVHADRGLPEHGPDHHDRLRPGTDRTARGLVQHHRPGRGAGR